VEVTVACRYLKLKFSEIAEAKSCIDELQNFREGVTVKHFTKDDSESTLSAINLLFFM